MFDRIVDWGYTVRPRFPLGWLSWPILWAESVAIFFGQSDAHSWWSHYLVLALGTAVLWPFTGPWGGTVLLFIYWGREVYQIAKRPRGIVKWYDDLPDFVSALLGYLLVLGLLT